MPIAYAAATNTSQPRIAFRRWRALQPPARAARVRRRGAPDGNSTAARPNVCGWRRREFIAFPRGDRTSAPERRASVRARILNAASPPVTVGQNTFGYLRGDARSGPGRRAAAQRFSLIDRRRDRSALDRRRGGSVGAVSQGVALGR